MSSGAEPVIQVRIIAPEIQLSSVNSRASMNGLADVLGSMREKGVKLWSENGQLRYRVPKGALSKEEIENLRLSREQIVALLEAAAGAGTTDPRLAPHSGQLGRSWAPLAYSQLSRWRLLRAGEVPSLRQVASAIRLRGRLNVDVLRKSVAAVVHRHDALRTRIVCYDGSPIQEIAEAGDCDLPVQDLRAVPQGLREVEVHRMIERVVVEPVDLALDPLLRARLLVLGDDEHVLILAMEHVISDGISLSILQRDLISAYMQTVQGRPLCLPDIGVQFPDYAFWQRSEQETWIGKNMAYWDERLAGCRRLRFPDDKTLPAAALSGWGTVPLMIGKDLKDELRDWCRRRRTTLPMSVFTAFVALVLRWCDTSESVIRYQSDGRTAPEVENTIGFFASILHLRLELLEGDSFVDLVKRVTEEYCRAYDHADNSYLEAQEPQPEFIQNAAFNWVSQPLKMDFSEPNGTAGGIACSPIRFAHPLLKQLALDHEPAVLLYDTEVDIVGDVYFPLNRFSVATMQRFERNLSMFITVLLKSPERCVKNIPLL